jgi:hypothetical protein
MRQALINSVRIFVVWYLSKFGFISRPSEQEYVEIEMNFKYGDDGQMPRSRQVKVATRYSQGLIKLKNLATLRLMHFPIFCFNVKT